jgi:hypothetical protein
MTTTKPAGKLAFAYATITKMEARIAELEAIIANHIEEPLGMVERAAPAVERQEPVACSHEWTDDGEFLLVCTACGAQENHNPEWRDMAYAPRDGTLLRLLVEFDEHSTEDEDQAPTIGANNFDNDEQDEWLFAGWCWTHDHWVQGKGAPIGWLPMIDTSPPAPVSVVLPRYASVGKGGDYELLGVANGAGTLKGIPHMVYRNVDGVMFVREPEDFLLRMARLDMVKELNAL